MKTTGILLVGMLVLAMAPANGTPVGEDMRSSNIAALEAYVEDAAEKNLDMNMPVTATSVRGDVQTLTLGEAIAMVADEVYADADLSVEFAGGTGAGPMIGSPAYANEVGVGVSCADVAATQLPDGSWVLTSSVSSGGSGVTFTYSDPVAGFDYVYYAGTLVMEGSELGGFCLDFFGLILTFFAINGVSVGVDMSGDGGAPGVPAVNPEDAATCATSGVAFGPVSGTLDGDRVEDVWCAVSLTGQVYYMADNVAQATAADLYACLSTTTETDGLVSCSDDAFRCTYTPNSGYWCPEGEYSGAAGIYYLFVDRYDGWITWFNEPQVSEYAATVRDAGSETLMAQVADDRAERVS